MVLEIHRYKIIRNKLKAEIKIKKKKKKHKELKPKEDKKKLFKSLNNYPQCGYCEMDVLFVLIIILLVVT